MNLLRIFISGLLCYLGYYAASLVFSGVILTVIALIIVLIFIGYILRVFGINL